MAKLGAYYALCPLIDNNSLLGVSEDREKGLINVTLGKNISSRYKLSDQKQLTCWRTKEKFSSSVIYDENFKKYVAVFNQSYIRMWDLDDNLDECKKVKFSVQIHDLISNGKTTLVIFKNGAIHELRNAINERKRIDSRQFVENNIKSIIYKNIEDRFFVGLTIERDNGFYWTEFNSDFREMAKIHLHRDGCILKGHCFHQDMNRLVLLTFWSDGGLFFHSLEQSNSSSAGELFSVIDFISTDNDVSMISLDENYIALYGADCNEEGAALVIYNTQFKVAQTRQPFKLFSNGAKLWLIENAVLLPVGQHLAVVPFRLEIEQLAALIGSHRISHKDLDVDLKIVNDLEVASWDESHKIRDRDVPDLLKDKISDLVYQGMPESMILEDMIPEILKSYDTKTLTHTLKYFFDLPEKFLAQILKFILETKVVHFKGNKCEMMGIPESLQPLERVNLLDVILKKSFNDTIILPHLRSQLSLDNVLLLLEYIYIIISDDGYVLPGLSFVETECKLIEWCSVLIDSSYQKIVLSNDESVKKILEQFSELILSHICNLKDLREVIPLLEQIRKQKVVNKGSSLFSSVYTVEQMNLYS